MWYPPLVTQPPSDPISVEDAKRHCVVLHSDDDALFDALIAAARDYVERYCNTPLATQTIEVKCDGFCDFERLPVAPAQSVTSIAYVATDGTNATVDAGDTEPRFDGLEASIVPAYAKQWPVPRNGSRITLTVVVGYSTLPSSIKHAMLLWIADAYEQRENKELPGWSAFDALLCNYRRGS
ncbi:head-tail connector protein [Rhizobium leguminosarum]|uniref:head-tail connector protein n=1 Tax=Rhizobium leguminosarum TaxID=384 RepID=UPI0015D9859E|nr:head-tail connector protein [Rhizobium leguminosarum]NZD50535.1 phage head-tail connector protein [Rhizobium leguminosarum]